MYTYTKAGTVVEEKWRWGRSGCEVVTYLRNIYQVYTYMYKYILFIFLCARSKEAGPVGDETKTKTKKRVEGVAAEKWVRMRT